MSKTDVSITRLFGGPGSGKTTALLDRVEEILQDDEVSIRDILIVSYTRAAATEVRERLAERLDISPRSLQGNVATMHAKAYELLNLSRSDVVGESDKEAFCEEYGLEYEDEYGSSQRRTARSTTIGNKIIATSQWLQRTRCDVSDWYDVPFQWNVDEVRLPPYIDPHAQEGNKYTPTWPADDDRIDVPEAIRAWQAYKGEHNLIGFADMLERVKQRSLVPHVDYLLIDEFQDITKLQYELYEEWKPHVERVLIAGDDDQVVYAWQGADPNLLLDAERNTDEILPNSYRLPSRVLDVVNQEISHISKRQQKDLRPRKEGGVVEAIPSPSMLDLSREVKNTVEATPNESIMVLFRARYQLFQFIEEFLPNGIPFSTLTDQRMWTDRLTGYVRGIEQIEADESLTGLQARRVADMLQDSAFGSNNRDELFDEIDAELEAADHDDLTELSVGPSVITNHAPFAPDGQSAGDMLRKVTSFQRKSVEAYFASKYQEVEPSRVRVGTIHSAKGREADHVFVGTDLTEKVVEQMAASVDAADIPEIEEFNSRTSPVPILTDNERRVFYVGMSRARERLVLLENLVSGAPTLPISVLLHNEVRDDRLPDLIKQAQQGEVPTPSPDT